MLACARACVHYDVQSERPRASSGRQRVERDQQLWLYWLAHAHSVRKWDPVRANKIAEQDGPQLVTPCMSPIVT